MTDSGGGMCVWVSVCRYVCKLGDTCSDGRLTNCGKNIRGNKKKTYLLSGHQSQDCFLHKQNNTANDNYNIWSKIVFVDNAKL